MPEMIPPAAEDTHIGQIVDGRYHVLERIGHGGMGTVYKVVHTQIGKVAAMKLLHAGLARDRELIKRFHREAEAISKLNHPNIIQVFDFGRLDDSVYLVMEYLKGEDLGMILRRDGPLDLSRGAPILIQICDALVEAHELKIVHRDLKPENVRVCRTKDGHDFVKVLDFGLAKMLEDEKDLAVTAQGNLVGTPYYMAPETIRAEPLDHRCDIYSLGALAYRMFTGEHAFAAKTPVGVLTRHITDDLEPPSQRAPERAIPSDVDTIVLKAMAKRREDRFQSAMEMKHALLEALERRGGGLPPTIPLSISGDSYPAMTVVPRRRESDGACPGDQDSLGHGVTLPDAKVISGPVLSKEDLDFERRLGRGRTVKLLLLGLGALLVGFAIYWFGPRRGDIYAPTAESEPNSAPELATPLFPKHPVAGHLGQRVSATESDRDWYRLQVDGTGPQMLHASVSGLPNMDLTLELYDGMAGRITGADSTGKDGGEIISNWIVNPGRYFLLVREVWQDGVAPTENVTDAYRVTASWRPYTRGWEMEPNDVLAKASTLNAGETLRGYLGAASDQDWVKVVSGPGALSGMVSGIAGVDLVLELQTGDAKEPITVDEGGVSSGEHFENAAADGKTPISIRIRRKTQEKSTAGQQTPGLDTPYALKTWLKPTAAE